MIEETEMHPPIVVCTKERKSQEFGSQGGHILSLQVSVGCRTHIYVIAERIPKQEAAVTLHCLH